MTHPVQQNIAALKAARASVEAHPMCGRLRDEGSKFIVEYPAGDFPVDGLRVDHSANGLRAALSMMEEHWMGSYPAGSFGSVAHGP